VRSEFRNRSGKLFTRQRHRALVGERHSRSHQPPATGGQTATASPGLNFTEPRTAGAWK
jgi:hypothetical protein